MTTISSKINPKEYAVISHYANCCGETINDNPFSSFAKIIQSTTILAFNEIPTNNQNVIVPLML